MNIQKWLFFLFIFVVRSNSFAADLEKTNTGFFYPIGTNLYDANWLSKDKEYFLGEYHLGVDMMGKFDTDVLKWTPLSRQIIS